MAGDGDRIEVRELRVVAVCGVLREERERPQPLAADLDVWVDLSRPGRTDRLEDTVDYGAVVAAAAAALGSRPFNLLERAAGAVAEGVMAVDERVTAVAVALRKLRPPVPFDVAAAGVRVIRRR